jgi:hypothetical protein
MPRRSAKRRDVNGRLRPLADVQEWITRRTLAHRDADRPHRRRLLAVSSAPSSRDCLGRLLHQEVAAAAAHSWLTQSPAQEQRPFPTSHFPQSRTGTVGRRLWMAQRGEVETSRARRRTKKRRVRPLHGSRYMPSLDTARSGGQVVRRRSIGCSLFQSLRTTSRSRHSVV